MNKSLRPMNIPAGICQCGCGQPSGVYPRTQTAFGHIKGHPKKFILGHSTKLITPNAPGYIVDPKTGCWIWQLSKSKDGYGKMGHIKGAQLAHRIIYTEHKGQIPLGMVLDHLCRNRACVNPDHLEPVTNAENLRRSFAYYHSLEQHITALETILEAHQIEYPKLGKETA